MLKQIPKSLFICCIIVTAGIVSIVQSSSSELKEKDEKNGSILNHIRNIETQDDLCNSGEAIEGTPGSKTIRIRPQGNVLDDYRNLQWAVDNVAAGGSVELCEGVFSLGEGDHKKTVTITKGIQLEGKKVGGEWLTIINGGGSHFGRFPDPEIGPFLVLNTQDSYPNAFKKIWLRNWTSEAIYIKACNGFTMDNCKLTHPVVGPPRLGYLFIHAIFSLGSESQGEFVVKNNTVNLLSHTDEKPHDAQFVGIFGPPSPAYKKIWIAGNTVFCSDECFEVIGNDSGPQSSEIIIENNDLYTNFNVGGTWPHHFAVLVLNNKNTSQVRIERNRLKITNNIPPDHGGMGVFGISGDNFLVRDNRVDFKDFDGSFIQCGIDGLGSLVFGATLENSVIENNEYTGSIKGPVLRFAGGLFNGSRNNTFRFGGIQTDKGVDAAVQDKFTRTCGNVFEGNKGVVKGVLDNKCWY